MEDQKQEGFTLVEIMIVVGVILLLAGIAIPNLLRARSTAQEGVAMGAVRCILSVQTAYRATHSQYANLSQLYADYPPYIDAVLASGNKQGYAFSIAGISGSQFYITAVSQVSGRSLSFYSDEDGILCRSNTTNTAMPNAHVAVGCPSGFSEVE
jgi:prepilin-type N-terminal cleavage/methylation domain-containing protein